MQEKDYKEFDSYFRTMLENAEEEVPPQISGRVFEALDAAGKNSHRLPVWVRRTSAVLAAAAVFLVAFFGFRLGRTGDTIVERVAVLEDTTDAVSETFGLTASVSDEDVVKSDLLSYRGGAQKVASLDNTEVESFGEEKEADVEAVSRTEPEMSSQSENETPGSGSEVSGSQENVNGSAPRENINEEESYDEGESWDNVSEWDENGKNARGVAIELGGNVASNGNAKGVGRFGGFRAPSNAPDKTWIQPSGTESTYAIPVTFGAGVKIALAKRWSIGTGINYTMLQRTFTGVYTKVENGVTVSKISSDVRNNIHYIGIPLDVYFDILSGSRCRFYAYAGGTLEKGVSNKFKVRNSPKDIVMKESIKGVQFSVDAGLGVEFLVARHFGLFLDPGFSYYFDCDQPVSIRTQQPFMMNFELGFRFDI